MAGPSPGQCPYDYHGFPSTAGATETLDHHKATGHFPDYSKPGDRYIITAKLPDGLEPGDAISYNGDRWEHIPRPGRKPKKKAKIKLTDAFVKALSWEEWNSYDNAGIVRRVSVSPESQCKLSRALELQGGEPAVQQAKEIAFKRLAEEVLKWVEIVEE